VTASVTRITKITEICKKVMEQPNPSATIKAATALMISVEQICAHVMKKRPVDDEYLSVRAMFVPFAVLSVTF
jgi:hypothetical protein